LSYLAGNNRGCEQLSMDGDSGRGNVSVTCEHPRILHFDGDSFFASCEIALDPKLEGRPVWVGGGRRGDGIVIAANRSAKKFGIKTGTACFEAKRFCPSGVLCRPHYDAYRELSRQMFLILEEYAPMLVPYSIDEGFLDFSTMDSHVWEYHADRLRPKHPPADFEGSAFARHGGAGELGQARQARH
jgi:nucleotidyltransferase/DNA polymerase involved in DNA repair